MLGTWRLHEAKPAGTPFRDSSLKILSHKTPPVTTGACRKVSRQEDISMTRSWSAVVPRLWGLMVLRIHSGLPPSSQGGLREKMGFRMAMD